MGLRCFLVVRCYVFNSLIGLSLFFDGNKGRVGDIWVRGVGDGGGVGLKFM